MEKVKQHKEDYIALLLSRTKQIWHINNTRRWHRCRWAIPANRLKKTCLKSIVVWNTVENLLTVLVIRHQQKSVLLGVSNSPTTSTPRSVAMFNKDRVASWPSLLCHAHQPLCPSDWRQNQFKGDFGCLAGWVQNWEDIPVCSSPPQTIELFEPHPVFITLFV